MIDPRSITPLLNNMTVNKKIGQGPNGEVYLVTNRMDNKKLALKHLSVPFSESQTKALIYAGAVADEREAQRYYANSVKEIKGELLLLNSIKNSANLQKFKGYQIDQKFTGAGFDVYLISDYNMNLPSFLKRGDITRLQALNLGIDLCSALEQLRSSDLIHKDVRPENVFYGENGHFLLGDLGIVPISDLKYSTMPDNLITRYTAPEVCNEDGALSDTMDIFAVGSILYQVWNGEEAPKRSAKDELDSPKYADMALSEIILKACAYDPAKRYQSPSDMKQALVLYMQRSNISDTRLYPESSTPAPKAVAEDELDFAAIAATIEAGLKTEKSETEEASPLQEEATAENPPAEEPASEPAASDELPKIVLDEPAEEFIAVEPESLSEPMEIESSDYRKVTLANLQDDDLLIQPSGETTVAQFLSSLKNAPGFEIMEMDSEGNLEVVPGYENLDELPADTKFVESADNFMPVLVVEEEPEPISADAISAAIAEVTGENEEAAEDDSEEDVGLVSPGLDLSGVQSEPKPRRVQSESINDYDADEEELEEEAQGSSWKKVLITVIVLLVLAAGTAGLYFTKTDTITNMKADVLNSTSIMVTADRKNTSGMEVICSTAAGEVKRMPYQEGGVLFSELSPNTTYAFEFESTDGKLLLGSKSSTGKTNQMTNLTSFAPTTVSAVRAELAFSGTGPVPPSWVLTLTPPEGEPVVVETVDTKITVENLTPGTTYDVSIAKSDGDILGGTTTCSLTTMDYTTLNSFEMVDVTTNSTSLQWFFEGTDPGTWTVTCNGDDGSTSTQDVAGNECTLDGLTSGVTYDISISCESLKPTELSTISIGIPTVTITQIVSEQNEDGDIVVSWEYTGDIEPAEWTVSYAYDSPVDVPPTLVATDETSVVLKNLIPESNYVIEVVGADGFNVGGEGETTCSTQSAAAFDEFGCHDVIPTLYELNDKETPRTSFTSNELIYFSIQAGYEVSVEDKVVKSTYVIRDSAGHPIMVYDGDKDWSGTYTVVAHTGYIPEMPQATDDYTLEVYFNNKLLTETTFHVDYVEPVAEEAPAEEVPAE